jgi:gamma-glutamylcyclotransferase (GGCT)/AIG2-like uncharacterized protein YtfP
VPSHPPPIAFGAAELDALLRINRARRDGSDTEADALEHEFAQCHGAHRQLAVYGTLAPGRSNHHQVAALTGRWIPDCTVSGEPIAAGWAADLGFPALRWSVRGAPVAAWLFVSADLPAHWARLDAFEGEEYLRILVPVHAGGRLIAIANTYATPDSRFD